MTCARLCWRMAVAGVALLGALALVACGGSATGGSDKTFGEADVAFAQNMIAHHQQAVEMGALVETHAADPELKTLAAKIKSDQTAEIATMSGWLTSWTQPMTPAGGHSSHAMPGMTSDGDMAKLKAATGANFDRMFARLMIAHHNGAIQMAREEQEKGKSTETKALAAKVIGSQQAEVETLQKILDRL